MAWVNYNTIIKVLKFIVRLEWILSPVLEKYHILKKLPILASEVHKGNAK